MKDIRIALFFALFISPVYVFAEPVPPEGECPCDTGILEVICPNGILAPDAGIIENGTELGVFLNDPMGQFTAGIGNQDDLFCSYTQGNIDIGIAGLDEAQLESCRNDIINACGMLTRPIPTLSEWGLIVMAGVLGLIGIAVIRRKQRAA